MESSNNIKHSKNHSKTTKIKTILFIILTLITILLASFIPKKSSHNSSHQNRDHHQPLIQSPSPSLHPVIKNACINTLYPTICFTSLSPISLSKNHTTFHHILEFALDQTKKHVAKTRFNILNNFISQELNLQERNAIADCIEMLNQTLYELGQAIDDLHAFPPSFGHLHRSYGNLKTLLSAAMTNENTCIDGFTDLELESDLEGEIGNGIKQELQHLLNPILKMISNSLAMIKNMETFSREETLGNPHMLIMKTPTNRLLDWMTIRDRKMMGKESRLLRTPHVLVAGDGSGNYTMISEAVDRAPNNSLNRYVIKIKAGIYKENVVIPRDKSNIMLVGDGMNFTVITGSRNLVDGFSTFNSATLTVVGDRFLARDLTIINTSGPEKHQAVALRVTSNAAFYRCEIISYQDTLYAHSLRQFYRECTIQGTIDFIFGNAAAIFENCNILVRKPILGQANMITAQGREDPNQNTGISLQNCTITAARDFTMAERRKFSTFLGRPWRNYSRTVIMKSYIGELVHKQGWCEWNRYSTLDTVEYIEYLNFGPGSDTRHRVTWPGYRRNCSESVARQFTVGAFLHGADDWLESTVFPLFSTPQARQIHRAHHRHAPAPFQHRHAPTPSKHYHASTPSPV